MNELLMPIKKLNETLKEPLITKVLALLKVGHEENLNKLLEGKIYCRHLTYYKAEENKNQSFHDQHEGMVGIYQSPDVELRLQPKGMDPIVINSETGLMGQVFVSKNLRMPAFCLHAIHTGEWTTRQIQEIELDQFKKFLQIPENMSVHGKHVWVIRNGKEFNVRLIDACKKMGIGFRGNLVRYVSPEEVHGGAPPEMEGFIKPKAFSPEREYRYLFDSNSELPDPFILDIGSLRDISEVGTLEQFKKDWSIDFEPA